MRWTTPHLVRTCPLCAGTLKSGVHGPGPRDTLFAVVFAGLGWLVSLYPAPYDVSGWLMLAIAAYLACDWGLRYRCTECGVIFERR